MEFEITYDHWESFRPCEGLIAFYRFRKDECARNPLEQNDSFGDVHSFVDSPNHLWARDLPGDRDALLVELTDRYGEDFVLLRCRTVNEREWSIASRNTRVDGVWVPDQGLLDSLLLGLTGERRKEELERLALQGLGMYNQWCAGDIYEIRLKVYLELDSDKPFPLDKVPQMNYTRLEDTPDCRLIFEERRDDIYGEFYAKQDLVEFVEGALEHYQQMKGNRHE
jgi:hypothetical protein